ncbi:MAG: Fic family protein [Oscillospiraceae bacterium]
MGYNLDPLSDSCYPGTTVLINKFDIRDESKLNEVETVLVSARNAEWLTHPEVDSFDFAHYQTIHQVLFSDLYEWAGHIRTVDISKKGTRFCPASEIDARAVQIFGRLKKQGYFKNLPPVLFVEELVDFYCATNDLHPFREGNGRTQRAFLSQLIRNAGYDIRWSDIDTDLLMIATIQSANGVTDLLRTVLGEHII